MVQTIPIGSITLPELEEKTNLRLTSDPQFFTEWFDGLPELTEQEKNFLDQVKSDYFDQTRRRPVPEGLVKMLIVSPLLHLAGFYRRPFEIEVERSVQIAIEDQDEALQGRIDALVMQGQFWVLVIEAKRTSFGIELAIPQVLGYMLGAPSDKPVFGMVTNGSSFIFTKLTQQDSLQYDVSDVFLLLPGRNKLHDVLRVMKRISQLIAEV